MAKVLHFPVLHFQRSPRMKPRSRRQKNTTGLRGLCIRNHARMGLGKANDMAVTTWQKNRRPYDAWCGLALAALDELHFQVG